jgi:hypothetical protein
MKEKKTKIQEEILEQQEPRLIQLQIQFHSLKNKTSKKFLVF